jgi:hypothetical protein
MKTNAPKVKPMARTERAQVTLEAYNSIYEAKWLSLTHLETGLAS